MAATQEKHNLHVSRHGQHYKYRSEEADGSKDSSHGLAARINQLTNHGDILLP